MGMCMDIDEEVKITEDIRIVFGTNIIYLFSFRMRIILAAVSIVCPDIDCDALGVVATEGGRQAEIIKYCDISANYASINCILRYN